LIPVKRSYVKQSSPRQTEGLKVGGGMGGWVGFEFARGMGGGWVGLQKLIMVLNQKVLYRRSLYGRLW
jgi:hypothetical protein